ncbi:ABC transporter ATP-binding protein [Microvirga aerophila]|uniref:Putative HMP/thiamine import ATP-binding protein YkoD n=1 Tax=Microvirga aerophila TaxID=670291 RepID=A0A512BRD6_9HYPH|nr:ATP-binding cassette domain-containing protein [Microvirga aerophila]GEO14530.1 putative HMP/thiamine import ATP-binding protein YkoD [Microvirga aerophila]
MPESAPVAEWQGVRVRYPFAKRQAVGPVDMDVKRGERVLLLGASGSGKSTLLLTLTGLVPRSIPAEVDGRVSLFGDDALSRKPSEWASCVAQYFQDADQTLCGMRVEDEIAFALENFALPPDKIDRAVTDAMRQLGLPESWRKRRSTALSGGERQLVALAATLVQDAAIFVADEPTAHLAPEAAERLHGLLTAHEPDRSVLIVDHRLDGLMEAIDRVVVLGNDGSILTQGHPRTIFREQREMLISFGIWCPAASELDAALVKAGVASPIPPLSLPEALEHLDPAVASRSSIDRARPAVEAFVAAHSANRGGERHSRVVARLEQADCAPFLAPTVLRSVDVAIHEGEILGIIGPNGAGKSTLGACLSGLLELKAGRRTGAPGGIAFQRPENQFVSGSVRDELLGALPKAMTGDEKTKRISGFLETWGLEGLESRHPFELSQGQKRRLALATLTISDRWPLLILDEPIAGLDARAASVLEAQVLEFSRKGRAIAVITHDMDLALRLCFRSVVVGEGCIIADGPTEQILSDPELLKRAGLAEPSCAKAREWLLRVAMC